MSTEPTTRPLREPPGGGFLAYTVSHEAYYARILNRDEPQIYISASHDGRGGGVSWEFGVTDTTAKIGQKSLKLEMFDDAWAALNDVPEVLAAMADGRICSLDDLRALLDSLGAVDQTARVDPDGKPRAAQPDLREAARILREAGISPEVYAQQTDQPYRVVTCNHRTVTVTENEHTVVRAKIR